MSNSINHCLVLDCSDQQLSVALYVNGRTIGHSIEHPRQHSLQLLPTIAELHLQHDVSINQLQVVGVGAGPGSFTGLRVAISCAQALSYCTQCKIVALSSLHALAITAAQSIPSDYILTCIDARMGELYWGLYQFDKTSKRVINITSDSICAVDGAAIMQSLTRARGDIIAVGSGVTHLVLPENVRYIPHCSIDATLLIPEILAKHQMGLTIPLKELEPVYLRGSSAWKKLDQQNKSYQ